MAGIIEQAQEEQEAPEAPEQEEAEAPEQEQPQQDDPTMKLVLAAMQVLYSDQTFPGVVKMLRMRNTSPAAVVANVTLHILKALIEKSQGLPPQIVAPAAKQIVPLVAELARAAGIQIDDAGVQQADAVVQQSLAKRFPQQQAQPQQPQQPAQPAPEGA